MKKERLNPHFLENSILRFLNETALNDTIRVAEEIEWPKGVVQNRENPQKFFYILIEGNISLTNGQGQDVLRVIPGRSLEFGSVISRLNQWTFAWKCVDTCRLMKIPWPLVEKHFMVPELRYLRFVSSSVAVQKLKNDMLAVGVSREAIQEFVTAMRFATLREILQDWTQETFFVLDSRDVSLVLFINGREIEVAHYKPGDSVLLDLPSLDVAFDADPESTAYVIQASRWGSLKFKDEILKFFDVYRKIGHVDEPAGQENTIALQTFSTKQNAVDPLNQSKNQLINSAAEKLSVVSRLKKVFRVKKFVEAVPSSISGFAALREIGRRFRVDLSLDQMVLKFGIQDSVRNLSSLQKAASSMGFQGSVTTSTNLDPGGGYLIVPALDEYLVVFARREGEVLIADFSSGWKDWVPVEQVQKKRSGKEVLAVRGFRPTGVVGSDTIPWSLLLKTLVESPATLLLVAFGGVFSIGLAFVMPLLIGGLSDALIRGEKIEKIFVFVGGAAVISVIGVILTALKSRLVNFFV